MRQSRKPCVCLVEVAVRHRLLSLIKFADCGRVYVCYFFFAQRGGGTAAAARAQVVVGSLPTGLFVFTAAASLVATTLCQKGEKKEGGGFSAVFHQQSQVKSVP